MIFQISDMLLIDKIKKSKKGIVSRNREKNLQTTRNFPVKSCGMSLVSLLLEQMKLSVTSWIDGWLPTQWFVTVCSYDVMLPWVAFQTIKHWNNWQKPANQHEAMIILVSENYWQYGHQCAPMGNIRRITLTYISMHGIFWQYVWLMHTIGIRAEV